MKGRLILVLILATVWFVAVGLRLVELQVTDHQSWVQQAQRQQQEVVTVYAPRGTIYDARMRPLAVSVPVDSAYAEPRKVGDPVATARAVASVIPGLDAEKLAERLEGGGPSVVVERKLDPPRARALEALDLPGVYFVEETKRYYPNRELAAAVLGFVGTDDVGLAGLEATYDRVVAGQAYRRSLLRDAHRGTAWLPGRSEGRPGRDLVLTLDATLQHLVERELRRTVEEHGAEGGSVVMLDPRTGAVLAMASYPAFNPNHFGDYPPQRWRNRPVQDAYEPGSTFKLVTAAAALASNRVDPADRFDCGMGEIRVDGRRIRDHKPFGELSFRQVMARSSNVGAIRAGLAVGGGRLFRMIHALGFGRPTGIDLPGESGGLVHPMEDRHRLAAAYVSFGQGLSVTSLQLANAFATVANGGTRLRPHVVARIEAGDGEAPEVREPEVLDRPLHPSTARELGRILEGVVTEGATGHAAAVPGYRVAGKTGTAQTAVAGGYSSTRFIASFAGWAPARDPALVAVIVVDAPRLPLYHGGQVAAPAFRAMVERALLYLGVPPAEGPYRGHPGVPGEGPGELDSPPPAPGREPRVITTGPMILAAAPASPDAPLDGPLREPRGGGGT